MADIAHHTHNLAFFAASVTERLPDRILPRKEIARHGFVDQNYRSTIQRVVCCEHAALFQSHAHGFDVAVADQTDKSGWIFIRRICLSFDACAPSAIPSERQGIGETGRLYTGNVSDETQRFRDIAVLLRLRTVLRVGIDTQRSDAF